jgi:hypothetical protein
MAAYLGMFYDYRFWSITLGRTNALLWRWSMKQAICPHCACMSFLVFEDYVQCAYCKTKYEFSFIAPGLCETKANDVVKIIIDI